MYLDSIAFKAMEGGLAQLNVKQQVHAQNIANIDTPDYKYKQVSFENTLERAKEDQGTRRYSFQAEISEIENTEVLVDGNNVDVDKENLELYSTYIQSSAIIQKMNSAISDLRYVLTNTNFK
ncbi:MAG: flagellar basal body rod protein FlgB [Porcipelethomonas sp.]